MAATLTHRGGEMSTFSGDGDLDEDTAGDGPLGHVTSVNRNEVRRLMRLFAQGRLDEVSSLAWKPGYGD